MKKYLVTIGIITVISMFMFTTLVASADVGFAKVRETAADKTLLVPAAQVFEVATKEGYDSVFETFPTVAIFTYNDGNVIDCDGNILDTALGAVESLLEFVIPAFRIEDINQTESFAEFVGNAGLSEGFVVSSSDAVIKLVRVSPSCKSVIRGVLDCSESEAEPSALAARVASCDASIAIINMSETAKADVDAFQSRTLSVWVRSIGEETAVSDAELVLSGANGIIAKDIELLNDTMSKFTLRYTLTRKPYLIGHRGMPFGNYPENSLESAIEAYQAGADMIESDIYISSDGVIFIMHDSTVDSMTNGTGSIETKTSAELLELELNGSTDDVKYRIPTLEQYFQEFQDTDCRQVIEIKGGGVTEELVRLIEKYDMADRCIIISFNISCLGQVHEALPEVPISVLTSAPERADDVLASAYKLCTYYNCGYDVSTSNSVNRLSCASLNYRGINVWTWTYGSNYAPGIIAGSVGLTGNDSTAGGKLICEAYTDNLEYNIKVGEVINPKIFGVSYNGEIIEATAAKSGGKWAAFTISGEDCIKVTSTEGSVTALAEGTAEIVLAYRSSASNTYHIPTKIVTVNISAPDRIRGDVDLTYSTPDISDALLLFKHIAGVQLLTDATALLNADVNEDGNITVSDALLLFKYVAGVA